MLKRPFFLKRKKKCTRNESNFSMTDITGRTVAAAATTTTEVTPKSPSKKKVFFDLNIAVVGEPATGKSAIISRLTNNTFPPFYKPTNGVDHSVSTVEIDEGIEAKINFWDISGHERSGTTTGSYYSKCTGFIFVFDRTRDLTLSSLLNWNMDINAGKNSYGVVFEENSSKILIANKSDLINSSYDIYNQEAEISSFSETCGIIECFECSAKSGLGLDKAIRTLAKNMVDELRKKGVVGKSLLSQSSRKTTKPKVKQQDLGPALFQSWRF